MSKRKKSALAPQVRGSALDAKVRADLAWAVEQDPADAPINVRAVAARVMCSPTSLYGHKLVDEIETAAAKQRAKSSYQRRTVDERIAALTDGVMTMRCQIDGWIERWVTLEHWALTYGYDAEKLIAPLPSPNRPVLRVLRRTGRPTTDGRR